MKSLATLITAAALTACGTQPETSETKVTSIGFEVQSLLRFAPGEFKMYDQPNHTVEPGCDVFTKLNLINGPKGPRAVLSEHVTGQCDLFIEENRRVYSVTVSSAGCGSKLYSGVSEDDARSHIRITDHRTRMCDDEVPATVISTETRPEQGAVTIYSLAR